MGTAYLMLSFCRRVKKLQEQLGQDLFGGVYLSSTYMTAWGFRSLGMYGVSGYLARKLSARVSGCMWTFCRLCSQVHKRFEPIFLGPILEKMGFVWFVVSSAGGAVDNDDRVNSH